MAVTPAEIDALPTYTTAQRIKWVETQLMEAERFSSISAHNSSITKPDIERLAARLAELREQEQIELAGETGGTVLVKFGEPR